MIHDCTRQSCYQHSLRLHQSRVHSAGASKPQAETLCESVSSHQSRNKRCMSPWHWPDGAALRQRLPRPGRKRRPGPGVRVGRTEPGAPGPAPRAAVVD
jgi:hypothetical protein